MPALQREAAWAEERRLGDLRQSVPQNGRVHLHIIDKPTRLCTAGVIPNETVQIWVCLFLYGWYYPGVRLQSWVCLICVISYVAPIGAFFCTSVSPINGH